MHIRVAGAQIPVTRDVAANASAIARAIDFAAAEGADVLLTPEGSLSGYTHAFDAAAVSDALDEVVERAASTGVALALGTCFVEPDDGQRYNQIRFYDGGELLGFHTKTLRCGSLEEPPTGEIEHYGVRPLRTFALRGVTIGGLICNDLWANPACTPMPDPHLPRQLATMGARVVFHAVNGGRHDGEYMHTVRNFHESNLQMRARASKLWIVTVDNCHPLTLPCAAPGGVVAPDGTWAVRVPMEGEQFFVHTIELEAPRAGGDGGHEAERPVVAAEGASGDDASPDAAPRKLVVRWERGADGPDLGATLDEAARRLHDMLICLNIAVTLEVADTESSSVLIAERRLDEWLGGQVAEAGPDGELLTGGDGEADGQDAPTVGQAIEAGLAAASSLLDAVPFDASCPHTGEVRTGCGRCCGGRCPGSKGTN